MKVELYVWLISSTIELTCVQVSDCVLCCGDAALCLRSRHTPNNRLRILSMTRKSIKRTWAEPFEMNVKVEEELNFIVDNDSRLFLDAQEPKKVSEHTVV